MSLPTLWSHLQGIVVVVACIFCASPVTGDLLVIPARHRSFYISREVTTAVISLLSSALATDKHNFCFHRRNPR